MDDSQDLPLAALRRLARGLLFDRDRAEDVVQEAWLAALRKRPVPSGPAGMGAWLSTAVRHLAADVNRDEARRSDRERRAARGEALPSAADLGAQLELLHRLLDAVDRLDEPYRTAIGLRFLDDLPPRAIAKRLGLPVNTVRTHVRRGLERLRRELDGERGKGREELLAALAPLAGRPPWTVALGAPGLRITIAGGLAMLAGKKLAAALVVLVAAVGFLILRGEGREGLAEAPAGGATGEHLSLAEEPTGAEPVAQESASSRTPAPGTSETASRAVRLRVLDKLARIPLPHYALGVRSLADPADEDEDELLLTDAAGEATLDLRRFPLPLELDAVDDPERPIDTEQVVRLDEDGLPSEGAPLELELLAGPTYALAFSEPPPADLDVGLAAGLEPALDRRSGARLREGELPWVRLDPAEANVSALGEGPWTLTARGRDGFWIAWGEVRQRQGVQAEPVVMSASLRGAISASATIGGAPIEAVLGVSVYRLAHGEPVPRSFRYVALEPARLRGNRGHGTIEYVEPGVCRVFIGSPEFSSPHEDVQVRPGERTVVRMDLEPRGDLAPLDVIARSQTGRVDVNSAGLSFHARGPDGGDGLRFARWCEGRADGSQLYTFGPLPAGEWEIELEATPHLPPWSETRVRARAGGAPAEFLCLDEGAPPALLRRVRVVEAGNGEPIPFAGVTTLLAGRAHFLHVTDASGEVSIGPFLAGQELEIHARAGGRAPVLVALRMESDADEPLEIALAPGWGALFQVMDGEAKVRTPLANVRVLLDGVLAGTTDERGHLLVVAQHRPARVELVREGYRVEYGNIDAASGAPSAMETHPIWVVMGRAP